VLCDNNHACGDGILWYIDKNSTNIALGGFVNGGSQSFSSGTNGINLNTLSVVSGDVIYLAIHPDGNYYCDDTFVDLAINVTSAFNVTIAPTSMPAATSTPINGYNYDRVAAVAYADLWAHAPRNPDYPLSNEIGADCNDCTNYMSQVLHHGSHPLRTGNESWNVNDKFQWWYRADDNDPSTDENSKTWSATDWFKNYIDNYTDEFIVNPNPPVPQGGDFILLDIRNNLIPSILNPDGKPDHGRVLVGYGWTSIESRDYTDGSGEPDPTIIVPDSIFTLLANQHCTDRWHVRWDYNINFDLYGVWYIHVID
jgi:hypothetical protein